MLRKDQNIPKLVTMLFKGVYYGSHKDVMSNYCYSSLKVSYVCIFVKCLCGNKIMFPHSHRNLISRISRLFVPGSESMEQL